MLNLILSVVPDAQACQRTTLRVVRPGGRVVSFDKCQPDAEPLSPAYRALNWFTTLAGTDITRRLGKLRQGCACATLLADPSLHEGRYRVVLLANSLPSATA